MPVFSQFHFSGGTCSTTSKSLCQQPAKPQDAQAAVADIDGNYTKHQRASRELTPEFFDSGQPLAAMLYALA